MSEPKRYEAMGPEVIATPTGEFVRYEDYARLKAERDAIHSSKLVYFIHGEGRWANVVDENARLKAEVERLTAFTTRTIVPNEELQAQVERLTKAGDAIQDDLKIQVWPWVSYFKNIEAWNAAKEGKGQP